MASSAAPRLDRAERRALIEEAATQLFAQRGYAATTVEDIAHAAGVTKPMVYRHFESKQELCIALLRRHRDQLVAAPLSRFDPDASDRQAELAEMIGAWLEYARKHPDATRLLFTPITGDAEVAAVQSELHALQRATQEALLREFAVDLTGPGVEPMAEVTRSSLAALALWWLDHPEVPRHVLVEVLMQVVNGLIRVDGSLPDGC